MPRWRKRRRTKPVRSRAIPLTVALILSWADADHERTGHWPSAASGEVRSGPAGETWSRINAALRVGVRELPGGSSLAKLLAEARGVRNIGALPPFREDEVVRWATNHHARTGRWPTYSDGPIEEAPGENWKGVQYALVTGCRGLPGNSSLAQFLADRVGKRNPHALPPFTIAGILDWCEAHFQRTGEWPGCNSGPILDAPGETWGAVESALSSGNRGLPGGSSVAKFLAEHRGIGRWVRPGHFTREQVLGWCDSYFAREGRWPTLNSGPIPEAPGETWNKVNAALEQGRRGFPPGSSLHRLLVEERGKRDRAGLPPLTLEEVRCWVQAYRQREGRWPTRRSGPIPEAPGETWRIVADALDNGARGLPRGTSLSQLWR